jgi:hypothetical protein
LLSEERRPAEALPPAEEAVAMYRELAAASPDQYRPDLANSLSNLGSRLFRLDRRAEALPVAEEAVAMCRELAAASSDQYYPGLSSALILLVDLYDGPGQHDRVFPLLEEAGENAKRGLARHGIDPAQLQSGPFFP